MRDASKPNKELTISANKGPIDRRGGTESIAGIGGALPLAPDVFERVRSAVQTEGLYAGWHRRAGSDAGDCADIERRGGRRTTRSRCAA